MSRGFYRHALMCVCGLVGFFLAERAAFGQSVYPEYWVVNTRACPQVFGSDPVFLRASVYTDRGCMAAQDPLSLPARAAGRPVVVIVHGDFYKADEAVNEGLGMRDALNLAPDSLVVHFDWPSQILFVNPVRDGNEKARRAFVAGYHLARFLQRFPPETRIAMIGHSHGSLAILAALHLLGGGTLDNLHGQAVAIGLGAPMPHLRAVLIASATDHQWLNPCERLNRALPAAECILSLYNRIDPILGVHPVGQYSDGGRALGKIGLSADDLQQLGALSGRFCERDIGGLIGPRHVFRKSLENPIIAGWIAPYVWSLPRR